MEPLSQEKLPEVVGTLVKKVHDLEQRLPKPVALPKCGSCFGKGELAQLFFILMDEAVLFFDAYDEKNNRKLFQIFLEHHFTYRGDRNVQAQVTGINKEFSEAKGFTYREKHLYFIEKLMGILQARKSRLLDK